MFLVYANPSRPNEYRYNAICSLLTLIVRLTNKPHLACNISPKLRPSDF